MTQTIEHVAPGDLVIDANVRADTKVTAEWVAHLKEVGVLVPLLVERNHAGGLNVVDGQRRTLGAVEAGLATVPVFVRDGNSNDTARIMDQIAVNEQRAGLTEAEHVAAFQQLSLFGVPASEIAKKTGAKKETVKKALAVAGNAAAAAALNGHQVTLDQAATMVEFDDDPDAVKQLRKMAESDPSRFDHLVATLTKNRELRAHRALLTEEAEAAGARVLKPAGGHWADLAEGEPEVKRLGGLALPGTPTVPAAPADVADPVHLAARVISDYAIVGGSYRDWAKLQWFVLSEHVGDLVELQYAKQEITPEAAAQAAKREADDYLRRARLDALATAAQVRAEWLAGFFQRAKRPSGLEFVATSAALGGMEALPSKVTESGAAMLGMKFSRFSSAPDQIAEHLATNPAKAERILTALAVLDNENNLTASPWQRVDGQIGVYFAQLAAWGYGVSEVEESLIPVPDPAPAADDAADDEGGDE
ncbi:ParB/RepB/Spo0J family partition protein [Cryobacterium sp. AP23]